MIAGTYGAPIPEEPGPERDQWLQDRGWSSFEEYERRGDDGPVADGWAETLARVDDLGKLKTALIREEVIRQCMAETGETREIVVEMIGALDSMAEEAVLSLTDGEPTTLKDALSRYVDQLVVEGPGTLHTVVADLSALLQYPWPGECRPALVGDGDYVVSINPYDVARFRSWVAAPAGSFTVDRLTVQAAEGGGLVVRTRPDREPEE